MKRNIFLLGERSKKNTREPAQRAKRLKRRTQRVDCQKGLGEGRTLLETRAKQTV